MSEPYEPEVVKWFTAARRFPQLIGKTPDGHILWGGPYTISQVVGGVGVLVGGLRTTSMWGHFGVLGNSALLFVVVFAIVYGLGRLPLGGRSPLTMATHVGRMFIASTSGYYRGRPIAVRRPHRVISRIRIQSPPMARPDTSGPEKSGPDAPLESAPAPAAPESAAPVPRPVAVRPLSGVQQLLATSAEGTLQ